MSDGGGRPRTAKAAPTVPRAACVGGLHPPGRRSRSMLRSLRTLPSATPSDDREELPRRASRSLHDLERGDVYPRGSMTAPRSTLSAQTRLRPANVTILPRRCSKRDLVFTALDWYAPLGDGPDTIIPQRDPDPPWRHHAIWRQDP
jgi:hypothetical protein